MFTWQDGNYVFPKFLSDNNNENRKHGGLVVYSDHVRPCIYKIYKVCISHLKMEKRLSNDLTKKYHKANIHEGRRKKLSSKVSLTEGSRTNEWCL